MRDDKLNYPVCHGIEVEVDGPYGLSLSVQSFELSVAVNTIPTVTLNVDPMASEYWPHVVRADCPNVPDDPDEDELPVTELYSDLLSRVGGQDGMAKATIKLTIKNLHVYEGDENNCSDAATAEDQTVTLRDWILTDVGLSSLTATAGPMLVVVFSHPVVHLDRTGAIYEDLKDPSALEDAYSVLDGTDTVEIMDEVYSLFSGDALEFFDTQEKFEQKVTSFRTKLGEFLPSRYLACNPKSLFMEAALDSISAELVEMVRASIADAATPDRFGSSTWRRLLNTLCPDLMLQVVPTYDSPVLQLEPFSPWQKCSLALESGVVVSMDMSPLDPDPIIGVAMDKNMWDPDAVVGGAARERGPEDEEEGGYSFFFPDRALSPEVVGRILFVRPNPIVETALAMDWGANNSTVGGESNSLEDAGNAADDQDKDDLGETYAKAVFLCNYRERCKIRVNAIPMFYDSFRRPLLPGRVLTVGTKNGTHLIKYFYGYLTQMTIKGDASGSASMLLSMSYARPAKEDSTLVDEGTNNPCYFEAEEAEEPEHE